MKQHVLALRLLGPVVPPPAEVWCRSPAAAFARGPRDPRWTVLLLWPFLSASCTAPAIAGFSFRPLPSAFALPQLDASSSPPAAWKCTAVQYQRRSGAFCVPQWRCRPRPLFDGQRGWRCDSLLKKHRRMQRFPKQKVESLSVTPIPLCLFDRCCCRHVLFDGPFPPFQLLHTQVVGHR